MTTMARWDIVVNKTESRFGEPGKDAKLEDLTTAAIDCSSNYLAVVLAPPS
jgi:hypothetical protein